MWTLLLSVLLISIITFGLCIIFIRHRSHKFALHRNQYTIGFFHPFCNSGGGGERVLWQYIRILQHAAPTQRIVIYTGDVDSAGAILARTKERFGIEINSNNIEFIRLKLRFLITAEAWPRFTLVGQSIGAVVLAAEALLRFPVALFIDTTGFAFTYPLASFVFGARVHSYTHYPTISSDMLRVVFERRPAHNNAGAVSRSYLLSRAKWIYYKLFALAYGFAGRSADLVFVNSTWTRGHIDDLWHLPTGRIQTVYPPCDTTTLQTIPLGIIQPWRAAETNAAPLGDVNEPIRENMIMSLAQFRPEKDHPLQIRSFALFLDQLRARAKSRGLPVPSMTLVLIGGVRDAGDEARVAELRQLAAQLGIADQVRFELNQPMSVVHNYLRISTAALHTMWNEHFGIGVVEFMAAGVIPIAHDSGGPALDIVVRHAGQPTGYRATSMEEYAAALLEVLGSEDIRGSADMHSMRVAARKHAANFSDEVFQTQLEKFLLPFVQVCQATFEGKPIPARKSSVGSRKNSAARKQP
jgi:alpha-1,2-mannosyltransferase